MKTLNMQITLSTYQELSDNGELKPTFIKGVLSCAFQHLHEEDYNISQGNMSSDYNTIASQIPKMPAMSVKYALKIDNEIHYLFKQVALNEQITLSELSGRLFEKYYKDVK